MYKICNKIVLIALCFLYSNTKAQIVPLNNIGNITNVLSESSGITYIAPNRLYTHNDSGGNDEIYELDTLGNLIRTITINSANNSDWEDVTKDDLNNIYIGDFGNNNNDRTNLRIYKIPSPTSFSGNSVTAALISFNYPDQTMFPPSPSKRNYDAEGFIWFNDSLYIFTKNRTAPFNGYCKMYKIPAAPGNYTAVLCDSILLCNTAQSDCWVTSAALSPDKTHLALLNNNKIWWFSCFEGTHFFDGSRATATLSSATQKEGITFKNNHQVYITDELNTADNSGGNLYKADLSDYLQMAYVSIIPDTINCNNCVLTVDSFVGTLSWSNGMFGPSITPNYSGWHSVIANSLNNCAVKDSVYISYLLGVNKKAENNITILLNEINTNDISGTILNAQNTTCMLQLTDVTGKLITSSTIQIVQKNQAFIWPVQLKNGMYFLTMSNTEMHKTFKIMNVN